MPKKTIVGVFEGQRFSVENTWMNGISLFHEGKLVAVDHRLFSTSKEKPIISQQVIINGSKRLVEVFVVALLIVKIQLKIDGNLIAGYQL